MYAAEVFVSILDEVVHEHVLLVVYEERGSISQLFVADLTGLSLLAQCQLRGALAAFSAAKVELRSC